MVDTIAVMHPHPARLYQIEFLLQSPNWQVVTTSNEAGVLDLVQTQPISLILLGDAWPETNIYDSCRRLKSSAASNIPIIVFGQPDNGRALSVGADDVLTEPFSRPELLARLKPYLKMQQLQVQLNNQIAAYTNLTTRVQSELNVAHGIQQGLLPPPSPRWPGLEVVCFTQSAREVGGDFYMYYTFDTRLQLDKKRYAIAVGDVSGKGMPAALLMAISLASFKNLITQVYSLNKLVTDLVSQAYSLSKFLTDLDKAIAFYTATTRQNCALAYVELTKPVDPTQPVTLRAVNAGCVTPLVRRGDGSVLWVDVGGMPLGAGLGSQFGYQEQTLQLATGDLVILTSDGVVEANNSRRQMLGFDRLEQIVKDGPQTSAQAMLDHLKAEVTAFVGDTEPHDDLTMVVIQA